MDSLIGVLIMGAGVAGYGLVLRRTRDPLHPLGLLTLTWLLAFGFGHIRVSAVYDEPYYADPFHAVTYGVVLGSFLVFVVGFWLVDPGLPDLPSARVSERVAASVDLGRLAWLTLGFFAVASVTTWYFVRVAGAIPLFSPLIAELRPVFKLPVIGYLWDLHVFVAVLGAVLLARSRSRAGTFFWTALILASLLQLAFGAARGAPMTAWMFAATTLFYVRPRRGLVKDMLLTVGMAGVLFFGIEHYRRGPYRLDPSIINQRLDLGTAATVWGHTGASFKNLQLLLVNDSPPLDLGINSYDLTRTLAPELRAREAELAGRFGVHNSATYLLTLYLDFGIFGLLVMPAVYGALTGLVYRQLRERATLFWLVVHVEVLLAVFLAFRTHRFVGNPLIFTVAVAALVWAAAGARRGREGIEPRPVGTAAVRL